MMFATMVGVTRSLGVGAVLQGNELSIFLNGVQGRPPERLVQSMRASIQVMGPLLARLGRAEIAFTWRMCHWFASLTSISIV